MLDPRFLRRLAFGQPKTVPLRVFQPHRILFDDGLPMSTAIVARQGAAKTWTVAIELWELIKAHPEQTFAFDDWSGGFINILYRIALSDPEGREHLDRFVHDEMGGRTIHGTVYIMPLPELHPQYDPDKDWEELVEDQADRVVRTILALNRELVERNPTMGRRPIVSLLPNLVALTYAIRDEAGRTWQLPNTLDLLNPDRRELALSEFGQYVKKAQKYFKEFYKGDSKLDQEMATSLASVLDVLNNRRVRASIGFYRPGYTLNERGLVIARDGSNLSNNRQIRDFEFLRRFNMTMDHIAKRRASDPDNTRFNWVMEEVFTFLENPGVANIIAHIPSEYRNRNVCIFVVAQSLGQIASGQNGKKGLEDVFWSFGNMICGPLLDIEHCYTVSRQFFGFDRSAVRARARREGQHDVFSTMSEQLMEKAREIYNLPERSFFVRRFIDEGQMDRIIHVTRTRELNLTATQEDVERFKDQKMLERGVPLDDAFQFVNNRKLKRRSL